MDGERGSAKTGGWFDDAMTRRAVFGLLGLTALTTACGSSGSAAATTQPSTSATSTEPEPATPSTAATSSIAAQPSTTEAVTVAPATAATETPATETAATTAPTEPLSTTAPSAPAADGTEPSVIPGINANITDEILTDDAESYGGSWTAEWTFDDNSGAGSIAANVVIDVPTRTITASGSVTGPMLADPIPPIDATVSVDSYIYDDDGNFRIDYPTVLGPTEVTSDGGFGKFKLHVDLVGRADAVAFDAAGVANRPSLIPISFTVTAADGTQRTGTIQAKPG
jgi:hypothetical protein